MKSIYNEHGYESSTEISKKSPFDVFHRENQLPSFSDQNGQIGQTTEIENLKVETVKEWDLRTRMLLFKDCKFAP